MTLIGEYWGEVVDVNDPLESGRIRVAVKSVFDLLETNQIPWAESRSMNTRTHDLPPLGRIVRVEFRHGDVCSPVWFETKGDKRFDIDDYASATVIINKDLSEYDLDGRLIIDHSDTHGIRISLTRSDNTSIINIRTDNSISLSNGQTGQVIHLSNNKQISLGSENQSNEPSVLGDTNESALNALNDFVNDLSNTLSKGLRQISSVAKGSPYTMSLATPIDALQRKVDSVVNSWYKSNSKLFVTTKSKEVSLN